MKPMVSLLSTNSFHCFPILIYKNKNKNKKQDKHYLKFKQRSFISVITSNKLLKHVPEHFHWQHSQSTVKFFLPFVSHLLLLHIYHLHDQTVLRSLLTTILHTEKGQKKYVVTNFSNGITKGNWSGTVYSQQVSDFDFGKGMVHFPPLAQTGSSHLGSISFLKQQKSAPGTNLLGWCILL